MQVRMDGRTALVTGGSLGLGRAMARRFVEAGASVAIVARRPEVLEEAKREIAEAGPGRVEAYPCDVSDAAAVQSMFQSAARDFGRVDVLVNNAGTSRTGRFEEITDETWQADFEPKLF